MPPHYAISEAFIVLVAIYCGWQLAKSDQRTGAIGIAFFGIAAAIGVYRFASGMVEELAEVHKWAGLYGGLSGLVFIAFAVLKKNLPLNKFFQTGWGIIVVFGITLLVATLKPAFVVPLFLAWAVVGIVAAMMGPATSELKRFGYGLVISLMLFNVIFIRQSDFLEPNLSWHAFHTVTAVWITGVYYVLEH